MKFFSATTTIEYFMQNDKSKDQSVPETKAPAVTTRRYAPEDLRLHRAVLGLLTPGELIEILLRRDRLNAAAKPRE